MYEPIGSVVVLDDSEMMVMIMGYNCIADDTDYDYIGCLYPVGFEADSDVKLFNIDNIKDVLFKGYETDNFGLLDEILVDMKKKNIDNTNLDQYEDRVIYEDEEYEVL